MLFSTLFPRVGRHNRREREETDSSRSRKKSLVYVIDIWIWRIQNRLLVL